jgi:hypothetical protein
MNLSKAAKWILKQSLGTKRGEMAIALLSGPIGAILDLASAGKGTEALGKMDGVVDAVKNVIS